MFIVYKLITKNTHYTQKIRQLLSLFPFTFVIRQRQQILINLNADNKRYDKNTLIFKTQKHGNTKLQFRYSFL